MKYLYTRILALPTLGPTLCAALLAGLSIQNSVAAPDKLGPEPVDFAREILPILSNKCFACHGPDSNKKDQLRLDSFAAATSDRGGYRAIDPDAIEDSEVLIRIHDKEDPMPPEDAEKQLTKEERDLLSRWVKQGGTYAVHWAFVPPRKNVPAEAKNDSTPSEIVDSFIQARLQKKGLTFAPEADRATIARRAALVLTGLPPEPEQLKAFTNDESDSAYGKLVDSLMASPRFGEHQARYWLDAVRYGDTHGLHLDNRRGIFPYRDWVIKALNENLPLNTFITWQLAGDLLENPTLEQLVATGYVRMNPTTAEGGAIPAEFQAKNNFDRTETLGTVFLGMSLTCARCHTHKYDPIPQTEYYQLMAFFNSTAEESMDGNKYEYGPVVKAPASVAAWKIWTDLEVERAGLMKLAAALATELKEPDAANWMKADAKAQLAMLADPEGPFHQDPLHQKALDLSNRVAAEEKKFASTLVAKELPKPRVTKVLHRGEYNQPSGEALQPGIVNVMGPMPKNAPANRLGLARWLTSRDHPLVSRVLTNRIWQRTFGYGLVRTPEDFGLQGEQATHPQLLDWLAVELQDSNWDLKHMLRVMVMSKAFRQSSAWRKGIEDPENRMIARGPSHRLDAEVLRDIGLWASGLLDPHMGGEGVKPYQPAGLWSALMHPGSNTKNYVKDKDNRVYRRSIYVYWKRTSPHPMMTLFDAPSRESSCVRRSRSNTSTQSLGLLNESQRIEMARQLAGKLLQEHEEESARLDYLYRLLACRAATEIEHKTCVRLLEIMRERYSKSDKDAMALLSIGDTPRDETLNPIEHATWSQLVITILASDAAILLY